MQTSLRRSMLPGAPAPDEEELPRAGYLAATPATGSFRKRAFDILVAALLLIGSMPIWLLVAALIKATSPGPIFFRQERVGQGGRPFTLLKFRTMRNGASDEAHRLYVTDMIRSGATSLDGRPSDGIFKLNGDDRITGIGRWLRRTSFDELPQLINVLRGEMSLVGPRPPLAYEIAAYQPWQYERLAVRPGLTGLWQISGRNRLSYLEMCELDVAYIRTWSFARDLWIILLTPGVVLFNRGGAR